MAQGCHEATGDAHEVAESVSGRDGQCVYPGMTDTTDIIDKKMCGDG